MRLTRVNLTLSLHVSIDFAWWGVTETLSHLPLQSDSSSESRMLATMREIYQMYRMPFDRRGERQQVPIRNTN